jgi:hypothetical protein
MASVLTHVFLFGVPIAFFARVRHSNSNASATAKDAVLLGKAYTHASSNKMWKHKS